MRLVDLAGLRGGVDKGRRLSAGLLLHENVLIEETDASLHGVSGCTVKRVYRCLDRAPKGWYAEK